MCNLFRLTCLSLFISHASKVIPIIILAKIDLIDESQLSKITHTLRERVKQVPIITLSNETHFGYDELQKYLIKGKTYCLLGSSGVGKSTMLNNLAGKSVMRTDSISLSTNKGRHVTSHRELIVLESGGIIIDNPGMREVGIADNRDGLDVNFNMIESLSNRCKFKDCKHIQEIGCAVLDAVKNEEIDRTSYENYIKMEKEKEYFESTLIEKRKKDKDLGKLIKNYKKIKKLNQ